MPNPLENSLDSSPVWFLVLWLAYALILVFVTWRKTYELKTIGASAFVPTLMATSWACFGALGIIATMIYLAVSLLSSIGHMFWAIDASESKSNQHYREVAYSGLFMSMTGGYAILANAPTA